MRFRWKWFAALALVAPVSALACSPVPPPKVPPTQAQIDADIRATFAHTTDLIEFVVVERATSNRQGSVRVTRSHKGKLRPGAVLPVWTSEGAACGFGNAERGVTGRMLVSGKAPYQYRPMGARAYQEFARLRLVPVR